MSKYPEFEPSRPRYPYPYYQGIYLINDPSDWEARGRYVPIKRRYIRAHKRPKQVWAFHPQFRPIFPITTRKEEWISPFE